MKIAITLSFFLLSLLSFSQVKIHGNNKSLPLSTIYLTENIGGHHTIIDSCKITKEGNYSFIKELKTGYYSLKVSDTNFAQIIVPNKSEEILINFISRDLKSGIQIKKSKENKLLWQFMRDRKALKSHMAQVYATKTHFNKNTIEYAAFQTIEDSLIHEYNIYLLNTYNKHPNTFFAKTIISEFKVNNKNDYFKYTFFEDANLIRSGIFPRKITEYLQFKTDFTEDGFISSIDFILMEASANSEVYDFVLNSLLELFNDVGPDVILDYLVEEYVSTDGCSDLDVSTVLEKKLAAYKLLAIGNSAPNVSIFDSKGTLHSLYDLFSYSELTILFFGSSHCQFCKDAHNDLNIITANTAKEKLQLIYISLDTDVDSWKEEVKGSPRNWIYLSELKGWDSKSTEIFQIHKTPSFYIIDRNAMIISRPRDTEILLDELRLLGI